MNKKIKFLIRSCSFVIVFLVLIIPVISLAQGTPPTEPGLVACKENCGFNDFMVLVDTVIKFILYKMAIPIAAIMFAYAGFKMVTAGGEAAHARTEAKEIFTNTVIGLIIAVAAFLIIKTILSILGYEGAFIGFPLAS